MAVIAAIAGRVLIAVLFILSGAGKLLDPVGTAQMMNAQSPVPGSFGTAVAIFEIAAGAILALGIATRLVSILLIAFTALATIFFHNQVTDQLQATMALKNLAIIGGLLMVFAYAQVRGKLGTWRERDRANEAEVKAARAEGRVEGHRDAPATTVRHSAPDRPGDRV